MNNFRFPIEDKRMRERVHRETNQNFNSEHLPSGLHAKASTTIRWSNDMRFNTPSHSSPVASPEWWYFVRNSRQSPTQPTNCLHDAIHSNPGTRLGNLRCFFLQTLHVVLTTPPYFTTSERACVERGLMSDPNGWHHLIRV